MGNKQTPDIRFTGFTGDWKQQEWIDTVDISTNMVDPKTGKYDDLPHIGPGNIESFSGRILDNVKSVKVDNLISGKFRFNVGDIIYGKINPQLGKSVLVDFEGLASADAYILNSKNGLIQSFLFRILQGVDFYKYSVSVSMRTGMPKINRDELNQYEFFSPSPQEQTQIGSFFEQLDCTIALYQHELTTIKQTKQGFLQKMFPKEGELVPEVRFPGFPGDWEEQKLNYFLEVSNEKNYENKFSKKDVFSVSGKYGIVNQIDFQGRSFAGVSIANYGVVKKGYVVYTKSPLKANPYGIIKTNKGKSGIVSTLYAVYKPKETLHSPIIEIMFENHSVTNNYLRPLVNKGAKNDMKVRNEDVLKGKTRLPDIEEQQKISNFFKLLDDTIDLHQRELEALQVTKKALLHKMFV